MSRFGKTPPTDGLPRNDGRADPQIPGDVELPLPMVPIEKFVDTIPSEASDALEEHTDLFDMT